MALLPQNPRDQKLLILAMLAIGLARRLSTARVDAEAPRAYDARSPARHARFAQSHRQGRRGQGHGDQDEAGSRCVSRRELDRAAPPRADAERSARAARVDLDRGAPRGSRVLRRPARRRVERRPVRHLSLQARRDRPLHQVAEFLTNIGSLPRIVAPINVSMSPTNRTGGELQAEARTSSCSTRSSRFRPTSRTPREAEPTDQQAGGTMTQVSRDRGDDRVRRPWRVRADPRSSRRRRPRRRRRPAPRTRTSPPSSSPTPSASAAHAGVLRRRSASPASRRVRRRRVVEALGQQHERGVLATPEPPPLTILREQFATARDGRRDPFYSLITTDELRPTMSDLRLTGILYDQGGGHSVATLRNVTTDQQYRVSTGSTLGRMRVSSIRLSPSCSRSMNSARPARTLWSLATPPK